MAMVFDKKMLRLLAVGFLSLCLFGCGSSAPKSTIDQKPIVVPLKVSESYMPKQQYDAMGKKIPYVSVANPYLQDKTLVSVAAKRAFNKAYAAFKSKKYDSAETQFQQMTKKFESLSGPWVKLAQIAEVKNEFNIAEEYYRKAIAVNKNNINTYLSLALIQRQQGLFSQAQNTYVDALNVWRDFPEAHLNVAVLYDMYLNQPVEAQKHFEAYMFLTHYKDKGVRKWLAEVRHRTKIKGSFIDVPPKIVVPAVAVPATKATKG